jgi:hypothetical protein
MQKTHDVISQYRPIKSFTNYFVDKNGNIFSLARRKKIRIVKPDFSTGYQRVTLYKNKKQHKKLVHRIVFESFCNIIPNSMVINHIDGDKLNNHISNLEMVTHSQNQRHALSTGLKKITHYGEAHHFSRFSQGEISIVISLNKKHRIPQYFLATLFNVSQSAISSIVTKKSWKSVP